MVSRLYVAMASSARRADQAAVARADASAECRPTPFYALTSEQPDDDVAQLASLVNDVDVAVVNEVAREAHVHDLFLARRRGGRARVAPADAGLGSHVVVDGNRRRATSQRSHMACRVAWRRVTCLASVSLWAARATSVHKSQAPCHG